MALGSSPGAPRPQLGGGGVPGQSDWEGLGKWPWRPKPFPDRAFPGAPAGTSPSLKRAGALSGRSRAWLRVPVPAPQSRPSLQEEEAIPPSFWRAGQWAVRRAGDGGERRGDGCHPSWGLTFAHFLLAACTSGPGPLLWRQFRPLLPSHGPLFNSPRLFLEHPLCVRNHEQETLGSSFHSHSCTLHLHSVSPTDFSFLFSTLCTC